ncbi:MAG TPA: hypothetical protein VFN42_01575 [Acetobacteraceae bacterium]|nr:hypothetical protein [Acetobacteraceae bacterium]
MTFRWRADWIRIHQKAAGTVKKGRLQRSGACVPPAIGAVPSR